MIAEDIVMVLNGRLVLFCLVDDVVIEFIFGFFLFVTVMVEVIFLSVDKLEAGMFIDEMTEPIVSQDRADPYEHKIQFEVKVSFKFKSYFAQVCGV